MHVKCHHKLSPLYYLIFQIDISCLNICIFILFSFVMILQIKQNKKATRWKNSSAKYKAECPFKSSMKCLKFDNSFYQLWSKWLETFMFERGVWQTDEFDSHLLKVQTSKVSKKKQQHKHLEQSFDIPINLQFFFIDLDLSWYCLWTTWNIYIQIVFFYMDQQKCR